MEYPKSSPTQPERSRRVCVAVALVAVLGVVPGCARETIGLGLEPDASLPMTASSSTEPVRPPSMHEDAGVPRSDPTAMSTAPTAPEPARFPRPIWVRDAQAPQRPPKIDPPPEPEPDAGYGCRTNLDCKDIATPVCRVDTGKCVRCLFDMSCPAGSPRCDPVTNECGCSTMSDCRFSTGACDPLTHQCLIGCSSPAGCSPFYPYCDGNRGVCLQCNGDSDCHGRTFLGAPTELCGNGFCVQCREEADCAESKRHCSVRDGACVECLRSEHCGIGQQCFDQHCVLAAPQPGP